MTLCRIIPLLASATLLSACGSDESAASEPAADSGADVTRDADDTDVIPDAPTDADAGSSGPMAYFIAVHNEPAHVPGGEAIIASNFELLREMVARADDVGIKLTLMFSAQWVDHIVADPARLDEVRAWKSEGHEIAAHHHSIYHGNWDGYTDYTEAEAIAQRIALGYQPEPYLGTLEDYSNTLSALDPNIVSGCMNDETDKKALPSTILFDTCLGYANHGDVGVAESDAVAPEKGINDFMSVGTWAGVKRSWLAHYQITKPERTEAAKSVFEGMQAGVYGAVLHSTDSQAEELYDFLAFLHDRDPDGSRSMTVREIIQASLLTERTVPAELLEKQPPPTPKPDGGPCGDGVCDGNEQANPNLCPEDCP